MKSFHIPRTALFFILFALAAFAVLYHPIDLKALVRASSQGTLRTEEVAHFGSTNDMDYHLLSMDSEEFQQTAELLSTVSCRKKTEPELFCLHPRYLPGAVGHRQLL